MAPLKWREIVELGSGKSDAQRDVRRETKTQK